MTMQICNTIVFIFARQHFVDWKSEIFIGNKKKEFIISSLYWILLTTLEWICNAPVGFPFMRLHAFPPWRRT